MTPLQSYYKKLQEHVLYEDPAQEAAMKQLQQIYTSLLGTKKSKLLRQSAYCKGLYLWGDVGRGKTHLMDLFYQHLPVAKSRMHFHQLMQNIHTALTQFQGQANPLQQIAKNLATTAKIVCLDEFLVHDIGDAMLLAQLLHALFQQGVTLVTTANTPPDRLYEHGVQRELFLPAITELKQHLTIFHLDGPHDYRIACTMEKNDSAYGSVFIQPSILIQVFVSLSKNKEISYQPLIIHGRPIPHKGYTQDTIWFDFTSICAIPRNQLDYLAITKRFSTVLISQIQAIMEEDDNRARLFIHLVDVAYDARTRLIVSSDNDTLELYREGRFSSEFKRTKSRLTAMSKENFAFLQKNLHRGHEEQF